MTVHPLGGVGLVDRIAHLWCFSLSGFLSNSRRVECLCLPGWIHPQDFPCWDMVGAIEAGALPAVWYLGIHWKWKHRAGFIPSYTRVTLLWGDLNSVMAPLPYVTAWWILPFHVLGWPLFYLIFLSISQKTTRYVSLSFSGFIPLWISCVFHHLAQKSEKYFKALFVRKVDLELLLSH